MIIGRRKALKLATGFAAASVLGKCGDARTASLGERRYDSTGELLDIFAQMAITGHSAPLSGIYRISRPITVPPGIIAGGEVTFDFRDADPAYFPRACLEIQAPAKRPLPRLSGSLRSGDSRISFKAPHKMAAGEAFQLSGTEDFAGNGYRAYYRKGEIFRVASVVNSSTVEVTQACRDSYPASDVTCWRRSGAGFLQRCKLLRVIAPDDIQFASRFIGLDHSDISNLQAEGGSVAAIDIIDCFEMTGHELRAFQRSNRFDGYGVSIDACQAIHLRGAVRGHFNGIATGGGGKGADGLVGMNRDIHFEGTASSDPKGGLAGANFHGNTEFSSFRGVFTNGVVLAGNNNEAHGEFIGKSGQSALLFSEMHGHSFLITGRVKTTGVDLPSSSGAINMGSSGNDYGPHARYGGRTIIDVTVDAPQASRIVLWRTTDLKREDVTLQFRRLELVRSHPTARYMVLSKIRGNAMPQIEFNNWQIHDKVALIKWSIDPGTRIHGLDRRRLISA